MKFSPLVSAACLAATASAIGPAQPGKPARPPGRPERLENWKWPNPFAADDFAARFDAACSAEKTFAAREFLLDDLSVPPPVGLAPYMDALKKLFGERPYPGSWDGVDPHGYDRNLLQMAYVDVPVAVREWIEAQDRAKGDGNRLFAVYRVPEEGTKAADTAPVGDAPRTVEDRADDKGKTVIFAPGAVYENLPLWVAEGSDCVDALKDLAKYTPTPAEGAVVAYPVKKSKARRGLGEREMEFTIKAQVLKAKPAEEAKAETPKAEEVKEKVKEEVKEVKDQVKQATEAVKEKVEEAKEKVKEAKEEVKKDEL